MARWPCFICGEETRDRSEDEVDGFRRGSNPWICPKHVAELTQRWQLLFPGTGYSRTEGGVEVYWDEMKRIEERFQRDFALQQNVYVVTDIEALKKRYI